jgi:hypothetical protein
MADQTYQIDDPDRWRRRAAELRRVVDQVSDPLAKESLLRTAEAYERWAQHPEVRLNANAR